MLFLNILSLFQCMKLRRNVVFSVVLLEVAIAIGNFIIPSVYAQSEEESGKCDPSYPDVCIASPPPDLNCSDIPYKDVKVEGSDPHQSDREGDGVGCES